MTKYNCVILDDDNVIEVFREIEYRDTHTRDKK